MTKVEMHVVFVVVSYMLMAMVVASWYFTTPEGRAYAQGPVVKEYPLGFTDLCRDGFYGTHWNI